MPLSWNEIRRRAIAFSRAPLTTPAPLLKAHQQLDRAVDRCCRPEPFPSDRHRVEHLFALYEHEQKHAKNKEHRPELTAKVSQSQPITRSTSGRPQTSSRVVPG